MSFQWKDISEEDRVSIFKGSKIFYINTEGLLNQTIIENKVKSDFGSSEERVDIYLINPIEGTDLEKVISLRELLGEERLKICYSELNEDGCGYYEMSKVGFFLKELNIPIKEVGVIIRGVSDNILDNINISVRAFKWVICCDEASELFDIMPSISGILAKSGNRLNLNNEDYKEKIIQELELEWKKGKISEYAYNRHAKAITDFEFINR